MHIRQSYWEQEAFFKNIDVAIIGSGIVGLSAAIYCKEKFPSKRVVVLERGPLPTGASTRNAGFACFGSLTELIEDLEHHTEDEVFALVERRWRGLARLRKRIGDARLGYQEWGGYEIFRSDEQAISQKCLDKMDYFNQQIRSITGLAQTYQIGNHAIKKFGLQGIDTMIVNTIEGQIHTGNMMKSLLSIARDRGVEIYNGLSIQTIEDQGTQVLLQTEQGWSIHPRKVLVATNGFARQLLPDIAVEPARNQVLLTEPIPNLAIKGCFHYNEGYVYFRNIDNRILLGGGRHLAKTAEATDAFGLTTLIQTALEDLLRQVILPNQEVKIAQYWSGILGVGNTKQPIIESVSDNIVLAARMSGMGVAIGTLVGEEGAEMLFG